MCLKYPLKVLWTVLNCYTFVMERQYGLRTYLITTVRIFAHESGRLGSNPPLIAWKPKIQTKSNISLHYFKNNFLSLYQKKQYKIAPLFQRISLFDYFWIKSDGFGVVCGRFGWLLFRTEGLNLYKTVSKKYYFSDSTMKP